MHELSIATQLIESILAVAAEHGMRRVESVVVEVGPMRMVVPEALAAAFEVVAEGTAAEGARLETIETPLRVRCRKCGRRYEPQIGSFQCPGCGEADVDVVAGSDVILTSVSGETGR